MIIKILFYFILLILFSIYFFNQFVKPSKIFKIKCKIIDLKSNLKSIKIYRIASIDPILKNHKSFDIMEEILNQSIKNMEDKNKLTLLIKDFESKLNTISNLNDREIKNVYNQNMNYLKLAQKYHNFLKIF